MPKHSFYCEPFAGGASMFFAKNKVENSWLNDIDVQLVNTLIHIRDYPKELARRVSREIPTKERHNYYKNEYKPRNELDQAVRWYFLNRTSYSGIMNMVNCYWGYGDKFSMRPENWTRNIMRTSEKLENVKITSLDFAEVIEATPNNGFLFIDPPYFNADQDKFYSHSFDHDDHDRLSEILKEHKKRIKFFITYDECDEIIELYEWAKHIEPAEWNYTISRTDDQKKSAKAKSPLGKGVRKKGKELFILNYEPSRQELLFT